MDLVWSIPVVAAAVAAGLVAARARAIEEAAGELSGAVVRLRDLRPRLGALRAAADQTDERIAAFRARHAYAREAPRPEPPRRDR